MMDENVRGIVDEVAEGCLFFENPAYDKSIIGVTSDGNHLVYDYNKMIKELMEDDGMSEEEAMDFISYNTERALMYPVRIDGTDFSEYKPIIVDTTLFTEE